MPTTHEIASVICSRWEELSRDGAINREETIEQIIRNLLNSSARCVYCNSVFNLTSEEGRVAISNHVMSCEANPGVLVFKEAKKFIDANFRTDFNDTDNSDAEVLAAISELVEDIRPDVDSDSAGTITERVRAAVELAKRFKRSEENLDVAMRFIKNLRAAVARAKGIFGTTEVEYEKPDYYERVLQENNPA